MVKSLQGKHDMIIGGSPYRVNTTGLLVVKFLQGEHERVVSGKFPTVVWNESVAFLTQ